MNAADIGVFCEVDRNQAPAEEMRNFARDVAALASQAKRSTQAREQRQRQKYGGQNLQAGADPCETPHDDANFLGFVEPAALCMMLRQS